jgi:hypothetical protein
MTVKYNRQNSNFQIAYFIAGSCNTPDAAYFALLNLKQERQRAVDSIPIALLKYKAQRLRLEQKLTHGDAADQLDAEAELMALDLDEKNYTPLSESALAELQYITECMEQIQPHRKYSHLSDIDAAEAMQAEEWGLELKRRAENYLLTSGTIPHDHFNTMRMHPQFQTLLLPHIEQVHRALAKPEGAAALIASQTPKYDLPLMLGLSPEQED